MTDFILICLLHKWLSLYMNNYSYMNVLGNSVKCILNLSVSYSTGQADSQGLDSILEYSRDHPLIRFLHRHQKLWPRPILTSTPRGQSSRSLLHARLWPWHPQLYRTELCTSHVAHPAYRVGTYLWLWNAQRGQDQILVDTIAKTKVRDANAVHTKNPGGPKWERSQLLLEIINMSAGWGLEGTFRGRCSSEEYNVPCCMKTSESDIVFWETQVAGHLHAQRSTAVYSLEMKRWSCSVPVDWIDWLGTGCYCESWPCTAALHYECIWTAVMIKLNQQ